MKHKQVLITSFLLIVMISAAVCYSTWKTSVKDTLKKMPQQEQQQLFDFFEALIVHHPFGYTIFGDKPVSAAMFTIVPHSFGITLLDNFDLIVRNGSLVWQKYKYLFPLKNFILKFENNGKCISVIIINISQFKNRVSEHIDLFKKILGENTSPDSLLESLLKQDSIYDDIIKHNEILTGILYGYGKQNAVLYSRFEEILNAIKEGERPPFRDNFDDSESKLHPFFKHYIQLDREFKKEKQYSSKTVIPSAGFKNIQEELEFLDTKIGAPHDPDFYHPFKYFKIPGFRCDPDDEETKQILHGLIMTRKKLRHVYFSGEFLEVTLKKLTGEI